jgi:hypothetical protein
VSRMLARLATDATTARLDGLVLNRPIPNRDNRRRLTKTAREALTDGRHRAPIAAWIR